MNTDVNNTVMVGNNVNTLVIPVAPNGSLSVDPNENWYAVGLVAGSAPLVVIPNGQGNFLGLTQGLGDLAIPSIQSPNFDLANPAASPSPSWAILKTGIAYFVGLILSGGTLAGPDYVINSSGIFIYSGTPAAGNLIGSWAGNAGTDAHGNPYPQGISITQGSISSPVIGTTGANLNANPYFLGGYGGDWFGYLGTFTVEAAANVPAGAPGPFVGHYHGNPGGVGYEGGNVFGVTAGTSVTVSAVVFNPTGTTVTLGLNAGGGILKTLTVPNGNWTFVQTTIAIPAGVNTAFVQVGIDPASSDSDIYFWGVTVQGPVPGQAITAQSITAAQLVAGIVVAGIIDGTTVNAVTFNGSVFNGPDFTVNSNGIFFYSSAPAAGNLIASSASVAGTDSHGNAYLAGDTVYGPSGSYISINSTPVILFRPPGSAHVTVIPQVAATILNAGAVNEQVGIIVGSGKAGHDDMALQMYSQSADGTIQATFIAEAGGTNLVTLNKTGMGLLVPVTANSGTPGSPTNITSDTWHQATVFNNGWTAQGAGFWYRLTNSKELEIIGDLAGGPAGNSSIITFTGAYVPNLSHNRPCGQNNPGGTSPPWINLSNTGVLAAIGVPNAGEEIFFHVFIPVNLVNGGFG